MTRVRVVVAATAVAVLGTGTAALALRHQPASQQAVNPGPVPATSGSSAPTTTPSVSPSAVPSSPNPSGTSSAPTASPSRTSAKAAVPVGLCANHVAPGTAVKYSRKLFSAPAGATSNTSGGVTTVRYDHQYTWAGLFLTLPRGTCRYRLDLEAQMIEPTRTMVAGEGWGYGIGPCNLLTNGHPLGYSLQHAMIMKDDAAAGNSGTFRNPDVNDGTVVDVPADYGWHQWTFEVDGDSVTVTREFGVAVTTGRVAGATGLPANCDSAGIFLRVFNGAAGFRNISVMGL